MSKQFYIFILALAFSTTCLAQNQDSLSLKYKKRQLYSSILVPSVWAVGTASLYHVWYSKYTTSHFHFFNDNNEWMQMDKLGHVYTANKLASTAYDYYKWVGFSDKKAIIRSTIVSIGFQTTLEILDGFSSNWGFSIGDEIANITGDCLFSTQQYFLHRQLVIPKFSYHATPFANLRPNILGSTFQERLLKDYNGQTYWYSFSPFASKKLNWLCLSFGYSINAKIVGSENLYIDPITNYKYQASRKFVFSLDIDFGQLPIKNKVLKAISKQLNYIKVPFPSLILNENQLRFQGIYF